MWEIIKKPRILRGYPEKEGEEGIAVKERFVYDAQNRLWQHYHQVDNNTEELLAENSYNELSQLANKKVGNNLQSIDYTYNIRGWMTHINKDQMALGNLGGKLFSYNIKYNQKEGIENPDQVQFSGKNVKVKYNGNIAEVDWRAVEIIGENPSTTPERYGYAYDRLNRLLAGYYQNPNNPNSKENTESLDYDLNGNITNLYRTSVFSIGTNIATVIDDLSYTYNGNQATNINDLSNNFAGYEGGGWPIDYDANGNMTRMFDKGIFGIEYNHLSLPNSISIDRNGYENLYTTTLYRADGSKLRKNTVSTVTGFRNSTVTTEITDYLDGFQYKNTKMEVLGGGSPGDLELLLVAPVETSRAMEIEAFSLEDLIEPADPRIINPIGGITANVKTQDLQFFPTAEGFYDYQKDQYIYQYKDHLGNARVSFGRDSFGILEITDANDYYPFGMNHLKTGNAFFGGSYKDYKYNGKELQETGMYDYGARFYMPDIGRWGVVDPLAEMNRAWSPFRYGFNNPIRFIDPDGRNEDIWELNSDTGALNMVEENDRPDELYIVNKSGERKVDAGGNEVKFTMERDEQIEERIKDSGTVKYRPLVNGKPTDTQKEIPFEVFSFENQDNAKSFFEFLERNSNAGNEFDLLEYTQNGQNKGMVGRTLQFGYLPMFGNDGKLGGIIPTLTLGYYKNMLLKTSGIELMKSVFTHSHPGDGNQPEPSSNDQATATIPQIPIPTFRVYSGGVYNTFKKPN